MSKCGKEQGEQGVRSEWDMCSVWGGFSPFLSMYLSPAHSDPGGKFELTLLQGLCWGPRGGVGREESGAVEKQGPEGVDLKQGGPF